MSTKTFYVSGAELMGYENITEKFATALKAAIITELSNAPLLASTNYEFYVNVVTDKPVLAGDGKVKLRVLLSSMTQVRP